MVENRGLELFGLVYENYGICNLVGVGILSINHNPEKLIDMYKDWYVINIFTVIRLTTIYCGAQD